MIHPLMLPALSVRFAFRRMGLPLTPLAHDAWPHRQLTPAERAAVRQLPPGQRPHGLNRLTIPDRRDLAFIR